MCETWESRDRRGRAVGGTGHLGGRVGVGLGGGSLRRGCIYGMRHLKKRGGMPGGVVLVWTETGEEGWWGGLRSN